MKHLSLSNNSTIDKKMKDKLNEIVSRLTNDGKLTFNELYLFGSCSRGEARYNSDIDLLLLYKEDPSREELNYFGDNYKYWETDPEVQYTLRNKEIFEKDTATFARLVKKDRIKLLER